jgi:hypothetical protein
LDLIRNLINSWSFYLMRLSLEFLSNFFLIKLDFNHML